MQIFWSQNLKLLPNWALVVKVASGHCNYMGVVSRFLIASPGHRLMETHDVHLFRFLF